MIIITNIKELEQYKDLINSIPKTNYQQTYENLYAIHKSNIESKTYINDNLITNFIPKNEDIIECSLNIEPIIGIDNKEEVLSFINKIKSIENKTLYFPLVYIDSKFYKLLNNELYNYKRLYTSIVNGKEYHNVLSGRIIKRFENNFSVERVTNKDIKSILIEIEQNSWKYIKKQDMTTKKEQLDYYNEIVKQGISTISIAYNKDHNPIAYRLDALNSNKVHILKNSYKEEYKKYSPGTYMLIHDCLKVYKDYDYIDLYGGPGLAKKEIETSTLDRYDMFLGDKGIKELEENRIKWDEKNYNNYLEGNSIKEVFNKKKNVLVATSCFGLGPVGKLNAIMEEGKDKYNWYASGEEFESNIFAHLDIKDSCFTLDKNKIKNFIEKNNIEYAIVVLKNKMARLLKELNVKVVYVDSLPFMWSKKDAEEGKVPYNVDVYCAQKTIPLNKDSKEIFSKVENLIWVNPIVNRKIELIKDNKTTKNVIINIGGLHSPSTDGLDYVDIVVEPLLKLWKNKRIIITTSTKSKELLEKRFEKYQNVKIKTYTQLEFLEHVSRCQIFITSPGLTTILETSNIRDKVIFLPPQNISQFYNIEYGKKVFKEYKEITWNDYNLTLDGLKEELDKDEHGVIEVINKRIKLKKEDDSLENYILNTIKEDYIVNNEKEIIKTDGATEIINQLDQLIKGGLE